MPAHAHSFQEAGTREVLRALRAGPLTRHGISETVSAHHWRSGSLERTLRHAVASGQVRALAPDLFELAVPPSELD